MLRTIGLVLLVIVLILAVTAYIVATHVLPYAILQPERRVVSTTPEDLGLVYGRPRIQVTDSITLDAYYIPSTVEARANLIMLHGIGSCKEVYLNVAKRLAGIGYNLLLVDQRAHGQSGGEFISFGAHEKYDVCKMVDWLERRQEGAVLRTGIYGNSMGGAISLQALAIEPRLRFGLIESTFTDLHDVTFAYGRRLSGLPLPRWLTDYVLRRGGQLADFDPATVRPVDDARRITQPTLLMHGDADLNIDIAHGRELHGALGGAEKDFYVIPGGGHADLWDRGGAAYEERFFGFLRRMIEKDF